MSKERLEEIAYNVGISLDGEKALMSSDDYDFLYNYALEQAERVQELEDELQELKKKLLTLTKENNQVNDELIDEFRQNKRYREALEEIARGSFPGASYKARKALEESEVVFL